MEVTDHLAGASNGSRNDHFDIRRRRLLFRCWHSGTREIDLIAGLFAEACLADIDSVQLEQFEALLDCPDPDLLDWIVNGVPPPPEHDHDLMHRLRDFCAARHFWRQQHDRHQT